MSKFETMLNKVFDNLLKEDNTGIPPTSSDVLSSNTSYDYTVSIVRELIRTGLLNAVDVKDFIVGDNINKGYYFIWDYKDLAYVVRVLPSKVAAFEVTITNLKDKADVKRIGLHEEDTVNEVVDYLNQKRKEKEDNEGKPVQTSETPSALPGGTAPPAPGAIPVVPPMPPASNTSNYVAGLK